MNKPYTLVGWDCPLGFYPAPLVPIVEDDKGNLKAVYLNDNYVPITDIVDQCAKLNKLSEATEEVQSSLERFDYTKHRLFGVTETTLAFYKDEDEKEFFTWLLADNNLCDNNLPVRVTFAQHTGNQSLLDREIIRYENYLKKDTMLYKWWQEDKHLYSTLKD
jgi:hypothetical protein